MDYVSRYSHYKDMYNPSSFVGTLSSSTHSFSTRIGQMSHNSVAVNDLDCYFVAPYMPRQEEIDNFNILDWWRGHARRFPILSIMAKDLLTPPVNCASSGNVITGERSLALDKVEASMRGRLTLS